MAPQTKAGLILQIEQLIEKVKQRHAALSVTNLGIYRGGKEPKYRLTAHGDLVHAESGLPIDLNRTTRRDLNAILWQLRAHYYHISQK